MSIAEIIFNIFNWLLSIIGILGTIGVIPLSVIGIVFLVKTSDENFSPDEKKSYKKRGIIMIILPWALIIGVLIFLVISRAAESIMGIGVN